MGQPSDTLLGEFRDAVYHRYKVDQSQRLPPAEGTELRAARFAAWLAESKSAELDTDLVRHWAVVDLMAHQEADLPPADGPTQRRVLEAIRGNAQRQPHYALTLRSLMPDLDLRDTTSTSDSSELSSAPAAAGSPPPAAAAPQEQAAAQAIERTNVGLLALAVDALQATEARDLVRSDIASLQTIRNQAERHFAAVAMGDSAQRHHAYKSELETQDPSIAREVEAAVQEDARRVAIKEERKRAESEFLLVEIERRPDPVGTAEAPAVVETARADVEAVRRISSIDERTLALVVMGWRAYEHEGYRTALRNISPDVESVAVALQSRVEDAAYKLPRDPSEDAVLDAAVRGLHADVTPANIRPAASNAESADDTVPTKTSEPESAGSLPSDQQAHTPVDLQDAALRRRVERARDWNLQEERNTVSNYYASQDVESDLAALRAIADFQQRALTLRAIAASAGRQVAYRDELLRQDATVAAEAVRHASGVPHSSSAAEDTPSLQRSEMTIDGYLETLPTDTGERPVFVTWVNGFLIPSRLDLGSFPDSYKHAASALARSRGLLLADDALEPDVRRYDVRGDTLRTAVVEGDARFGSPPQEPSSAADSESPDPALTAASNPPLPTISTDGRELGLSKDAAPAAADTQLTQERALLATIRDRHASVVAAGGTIATLASDEAASIAQADAEALRQIRRSEHLVEIAADLGESLEDPRYRAELERADFQVAKVMDTLHFEAKLQAEREKVRAARPRGFQGVLVEHGEAPYNFENNQPKTFYIKYLEDTGREGVAWGKHLPAALRASEAEIGDRIWFTRKATPPELRDNSEGLLPCDLAEFAIEVREMAQLPEDAPGALTVVPRQDGPTYRFRVTVPPASQESTTTSDVTLCEDVAGLATTLDLHRGHSVHVEDFRLGQLWQLEVDANGAVRSKVGSAFTIVNLSDADAPPAIKQEELAAMPSRSPTQQAIDQRLLQRVATLREQDVEKARLAVGLTSPETLPSETTTSSTAASSVDTGNAANSPRGSQELPAGSAPGGQQSTAKAKTVDPLKVVHRLPPADVGANGFAGDPTDANRPTPSETISKLLESVTYEMQKNGSVLYLVRDRPAFIDHGQQILMHKAANDDDEAVLAAVLLAKEKWGGKIELTGTEEFKRRALAVMLKHNVDVQLKNPQQEALRRELMQSTPRADVAPQDTGPKPLMGKPAAQQAPGGRPDPSRKSSVPPVVVIEPQPSTPAAPEPAVAATAPAAAELAPIQARDWWTAQRDAIHYWSRNTTERDADMKRLGPEPAEAQMFWFDKAGRRCDPPADAEAFVKRFTAANANIKELNMATKQGAPQEAPQVVLRGVKKVGEKFETTALLFKGKGDFLQGFITVAGQKRQVIVHMNERKPDGETGELRPNFLRISEAQGDAKNPRWREIGYGNAVNHRADGKQVYFDEVLFNVGNDVVKARATGTVDAQLHRSLGFVEARKSRAAANDTPDHAAEASLPKAAPAADVREAVAGAAAPTKSRPSSRARAAA